MSPEGVRALAESLELWEAFWEIIGGVLEPCFSVFLDVNLLLVYRNIHIFDLGCFLIASMDRKPLCCFVVIFRHDCCKTVR